MNYQAQFFRDVQDWGRQTVRLLLRRREYGGLSSYLMADGTWQEATEEGTNHDWEKVGLLLPIESIEAIATATEEFQGHASHADTEARVLREWLAVEKDRVDRALQR